MHARPHLPTHLLPTTLRCYRPAYQPASKTSPYTDRTDYRSLMACASPTPQHHGQPDSVLDPTMTIRLRLNLRLPPRDRWYPWDPISYSDVVLQHNPRPREGTTVPTGQAICRVGADAVVSVIETRTNCDGGSVCLHAYNDRSHVVGDLQ